MNEVERIKAEYSDRDYRLSESDIYSWFSMPHLFGIQQRQRTTLNLLKSINITDLKEMCVLEMGSGSGRVLAEFLSFGALSKDLFGVDLIFSRLQSSCRYLPSSNFANADGQSLPFVSNSFDLVLQYTAISSILNPELRRKICQDMLRVLKPEGVILSYDFWLNPTNDQTRGLGLSEIRTYFPNCQITYKKITLAPPIARRLVPISWLMSSLLEKLTIFNSHYLVAIRKISQ